MEEDEELYREMNEEDDFYMGDQEENTADGMGALQEIFSTLFGIMCIVLILFLVVKFCF